MLVDLCVAFRTVGHGLDGSLLLCCLIKYIKNKVVKANYLWGPSRPSTVT